MRILGINTWDLALELTNFDWSLFNAIHEVRSTTSTSRYITVIQNWTIVMHLEHWYSWVLGSLSWQHDLAALSSGDRSKSYLAILETEKNCQGFVTFLWSGISYVPCIPDVFYWDLPQESKRLWLFSKNPLCEYVTYAKCLMHLIVFQ